MRLRGDIVFWVTIVLAIVIFRGRALLAPTYDIATGLYASVGLAWQAGHLPYTTVWEYKPPGLFALYAIATAFVPAAKAAWMLGTLALVGTAVAVYAIARAIDDGEGTLLPRLATVFFTLLSSENDAIGSDVELEIAAFIAGALALALVRQPRGRDVAWAGAFAACALQCKLNAVFLILVPFLALGSAGRRVRSVAIYAGAVALPVAIESIAYAFSGRFALFYDSNVSASLRRFGAEHGGAFRRNIGWLSGQSRILAPIVEFAAFAPIVRASRPIAAAWFWLLASVVSILAAGELYQRHFVLLAAPVATLGAVGFLRILRAASARNALAGATLTAVVVIATFALHAFYESASTVRDLVAIAQRGETQPSVDLRLAQTINALGGDHPSLFVVGADPLLYDYTQARAVTQYRDTEHLFDPRLSRMAGVDFDRQLAGIFAQHPSFVVTQRHVDDYHLSMTRIAELDRRLAVDYDPVASVSDYEVYALRGLAKRPLRISTPVRFDDR